MKNLYESQHLGVWPSEGSGIILISNDGLLEILEKGKHLNNPIPTIETSTEAVKRFRLAESILFEQWFEIVSSGENIVHSNYSLDVTEQGQEVLQKIGLTNEFPTIIEGKSLNFFYFCGDFSENPAQMWTAKLAGGKWLNHFLTRFGSTNKAKFFRRYYTPLIESIISEQLSVQSTENVQE